jgi:hypothetical protein
VAALGLTFTWWARFYLGRLWSSSVTRKADHHVVDTGPYAIVRHPIYTGIIAALYATALLKASPLGIAGVILMTYGFWLTAKLEERFLSEQLGVEAYGAYRRKVPDAGSVQAAVGLIEGTGVSNRLRAARRATIICAWQATPGGLQWLKVRSEAAVSRRSLSRTSQRLLRPRSSPEYSQRRLLRRAIEANKILHRCGRRRRTAPFHHHGAANRNSTGHATSRRERTQHSGLNWTHRA